MKGAPPIESIPPFDAAVPLERRKAMAATLWRHEHLRSLPTRCRCEHCWVPAYDRLLVLMLEYPQ